MLFILAEKLLVVIALPVIVAIVWKWRTQAAWACLPLAFGAAIVYFLVRLPLDPVVLPLYLYYAGDFGNFGKNWPYVLLHGAGYGLLREGIRWLMMRFAVKPAWSWKEGVFFGLCYSVMAVPISFSREIQREMIIRGSENLLQALPFLNEVLPWDRVLRGAWDLSLPSIAFNVGTSLAVLLSVQRRQIWPFFVAVLFYTISATAPSLTWSLSSVLEFTGYSAGQTWPIAFYLLRFVAVLPPLWFALHLRKTMKAQSAI